MESVKTQNNSANMQRAIEIQNNSANIQRAILITKQHNGYQLFDELIDAVTYFTTHLSINNEQTAVTYNYTEGIPEQIIYDYADNSKHNFPIQFPFLQACKEAISPCHKKDTLRKLIPSDNDFLELFTARKNLAIKLIEFRQARTSKSKSAQNTCLGRIVQELMKFNILIDDEKQRISVPEIFVFAKNKKSIRRRSFIEEINKKDNSSHLNRLIAKNNIHTLYGTQHPEYARVKFIINTGFQTLNESKKEWQIAEDARPALDRNYYINFSTQYTVGTQYKNEFAFSPQKLSIQKNNDSPFIFASNNLWSSLSEESLLQDKQLEKGHTLIGKWLMNGIAPEEINAKWFKILTAIETGKLLNAKCTLLEGNENYRAHSIIIYVPDCEDTLVVRNTYNVLVETEAIADGDNLEFKSNRMIALGHYDAPLLTRNTMEQFYEKVRKDECDPYLGHIVQSLKLNPDQKVCILGKYDLEHISISSEGKLVSQNAKNQDYNFDDFEIQKNRILNDGFVGALEFEDKTVSLIRAGAEGEGADFKDPAPIFARNSMEWRFKFADIGLGEVGMEGEEGLTEKTAENIINAMVDSAQSAVLVFSCNAGQSRSAAMCSAYAAITNNKIMFDKIQKGVNTFSPNGDVYKKLIEAAARQGIYIPKWAQIEKLKSHKVKGIAIQGDVVPEELRPKIQYGLSIVNTQIN